MESLIDCARIRKDFLLLHWDSVILRTINSFSENTRFFGVQMLAEGAEILKGTITILRQHNSTILTPCQHLDPIIQFFQKTCT